MNPPATMHGIAISPTIPSLHSKIKTKTIPTTIVEKFITKVETNEVTKLLTCLESIPNLLATAPPLFYFFSNHLIGNLNIL